MSFSEIILKILFLHKSILLRLKIPRYNLALYKEKYKIGTVNSMSIGFCSSAHTVQCTFHTDNTLQSVTCLR